MARATVRKRAVTSLHPEGVVMPGVCLEVEAGDGCNWADVILETVAWVLANPAMSASIVAGVVWGVVSGCLTIRRTRVRRSPLARFRQSLHPAATLPALSPRERRPAVEVVDIADTLDQLITLTAIHAGRLHSAAPTSHQRRGSAPGSEASRSRSFCRRSRTAC